MSDHRQLPDVPELAGERIRLGLRTLGQVTAELAGEDDEISRWLLDGSYSDRATIERQILDAQVHWAQHGARRSFGIYDRADGTLVGGVEANLADPGLAPREANVAYWVFPEWRRQGLASEAVILLCGYLAEQTEVAVAVLKIHPDNVASQGVARRAGFTADSRPAYRAGVPMLRFVRPLHDRNR